MVFDPGNLGSGRGLDLLRQKAMLDERKGEIDAQSKHRHALPGRSSRHLWLEVAAVAGVIAGIVAAAIFLQALL